MLNPDFQNISWISGALSVGLASALMGLTKTIHPPAGATALLAATSPEIIALGWFLVPLVLLGTVLMLVLACLVNNIQRQFPHYWWTAADLGRGARVEDAERQKAVVSKEADTMNSVTISHVEHRDGKRCDGIILITASGVQIPSWISVDDEVTAILEMLRAELVVRSPGEVM